MLFFIYSRRIGESVTFAALFTYKRVPDEDYRLGNKTQKVLL